METLCFQGKQLKRYSAGESFTMDHSDYIIQQVIYPDAGVIEKLQKKGFQFHERFYNMEIDLKGTTQLRNQRAVSLGDISMELGNTYSKDLYELAYHSFETDRRFHLDPEFNQTTARDVKKAYIDWCRARNMAVFSVRKDKELLGYTIIDMHTEKDDGYFQIMLGVTKAGIKGKMIAFPMYSGLLERISHAGHGRFTKYGGYVSTANLASINLHHYLGARIIRVVDEYIYRNGMGEG